MDSIQLKKNRELAQDARIICKPYIEFVDWLINMMRMRIGRSIPMVKILPQPGPVQEGRESIYKEIVERMIKDGIVTRVNPGVEEKDATLFLASKNIYEEWQLHNKFMSWPNGAFTKAVWTPDIQKSFGDISGYLARRSREDHDLQRIDNSAKTNHINHQSNVNHAGAYGTKRNRDHMSSSIVDNVDDGRAFGAFGSGSNSLGLGRSQGLSPDTSPAQKKVKQDTTIADVGLMASKYSTAPVSLQPINTKRNADFVTAAEVTTTSTFFPKRVLNDMLAILAVTREEFPSSRIELHFYPNKTLAKCYDCPKKIFEISVSNGGWASFRSHLISDSHTKSAKNSRASIKSAPIGPKGEIGLLAPSLKSRQFALAQPSGITLTTIIAEHKPPASEQMVTIHQHNRLDADHSKLSHQHQSLRSDVNVCQKAIQEMSETITKVYKSQGLNDQSIGKLSMFKKEIQGVLNRLQALVQLKSNCITILEQNDSKREQTQMSQSNFLESLKNQIETFEELADGLSKATLSGTINGEKIGMLEVRLDGLATSLVDMQAKYFKDTEATQLDDSASQKESNEQITESRGLEDMRVIEEINGLKRSLQLERDANKAQRLAYEQQIDTLNKEKVTMIKAMQADFDTSQARNDAAQKEMADRMMNLENTNATFVSLLERVTKLENVTTATVEHTIVADNPGKPATTENTPSKNLVVVKMET